MADEVQSDNYFQDQAEPPPPAGNIPSYPELIMAAIEALAEPTGSNKSSISRQIEATYGDLPPTHTTLLTHHLNQMKSSGHLVFAKNNYLKPDAATPPRRGRGRPPKPKIPLPEGFPLPASRPRGRPPKSRDPDASPPPPPPPKPTSAVSGRKRGRPPKDTTAAAVPTTTPTASGAPRGRGRPPKVKPAATAPVGA